MSQTIDGRRGNSNGPRVILIGVLALFIVASSDSAHAQVQDDRMISLPAVSLGVTPPFQKLVVLSPGDKDKQQILEYTDQFDEIVLDKHDCFRSMSDERGNWLSRKNSATPNLPDKFFDHDAIRGILNFGPQAIPTLLDGLDATSPTQVRVSTGEGQIVVFARTVFGNPINPREASILGLTRDCYIWPPDTAANAVDSQIESYTLRHGDLCFVLLGQIVNRDYQCITNAGMFNSVVCSCAYDEELRQKIRAIWSSENPRQLLFESLMLDFSTRCVLQGRSLDGWDVGELLQVGATQRLLHYFPEESRTVVAGRLAELDVEADWLKAALHNGVRAAELIAAVRPFPSEELETALIQLQSKCKDDDVKRALGATLSKWKSQREDETAPK
jgi:hypothetical protein